MCADDRTARNARQRLDVAEHVKFGQPRQHADVEERGAEAAAGKRQPDFAEEGRAHGGEVAAQEQAQGATGLAVLEI